MSNYNEIKIKSRPHHREGVVIFDDEDDSKVWTVFISDEDRKAVESDGEEILAELENEENKFREAAFKQTFGNGKYAKLVKFCQKTKNTLREMKEDFFEMNDDC